MKPFGWQRLSHLSAVEYRLDESGVLLLRAGNPDAVPFATARVRDGKGGFVERPLDTLGFSWTRNDDGWELRTSGAPVTMGHTDTRWGSVVTEASSNALVDERFLLVTIACEVGDVVPDAGGLVRAPRTERGYPRRTGESDHGDARRDAEDWAAYIASGRRGTTHSSHGVMQTLVSTAIGVRPDLFDGVEPADYRYVLAEPASSIACGAAYIATFPNAAKQDPLAARFKYGAGSIRPAQNRWGAVIYDELVPLMFVAFWNDLACVRTGTCVAPLVPVPARRPELSRTAAWLFAAISCFVLATLASYATSLFLRRGA
jgi:hypothetical protein